MARFGYWNVVLQCLKYLESIARIRDAAFLISVHQIASNRFLSLMDAIKIVCASKRILANYS